MSTGWNPNSKRARHDIIINLLGNEYWLELQAYNLEAPANYKPTGK